MGKDGAGGGSYSDSAAELTIEDDAKSWEDQ